MKMEKTLGNTDSKGAAKNVKDIVFWGDGDTFKLISKASSKKEGWMKSTKAMEIEGVGCVVQVTTQQMNDTGMIKTYSSEELADAASMEITLDYTQTIKGCVIAEAVTFVPGVKIQEMFDSDKKIIARKLVQI